MKKLENGSTVVEIYKSYGVLAHEKQPFFSVSAPASKIYDIINIAIPFEVSRNYLNEYLVTVKNVNYLLHDILSNRGDKPVLVISNPRQEPYVVSLDVVD